MTQGETKPATPPSQPSRSGPAQGQPNPSPSPPQPAPDSRPADWAFDVAFKTETGKPLSRPERK